MTADVCDVLFEQGDLDVGRGRAHRVQAELDVNVAHCAAPRQHQLEQVLVITRAAIKENSLAVLLFETSKIDIEKQGQNKYTLTQHKGRTPPSHDQVLGQTPPSLDWGAPTGEGVLHAVQVSLCSA